MQLNVMSQFAYSTTLDGVDCHLRSVINSVIPDEIVNDRPHKHYSMEFHCVFAGEETVYLPAQNRQILLTPGKILLMPRELYHGVITNNGTVERICFNFSVEPKKSGKGSILEPFMNINEVMVFEDAAANALAQQCRQLRMRKETPLSRIQQGTLLLGTVLQLFSLTPSARVLCAQESFHTLRQKWIVEDYVTRHFTEATSVEGLAEVLYLSEGQTRKLVKKYLGEDYKTVIVRYRMELADIYLRDPHKTLEEIAWQVGYRSYSGFQLCFKKHFGMTPSERREQILGK